MERGRSQWMNFPFRLQLEYGDTRVTICLERLPRKDSRKRYSHNRDSQIARLSNRQLRT